MRSVPPLRHPDAHLRTARDEPYQRSFRARGVAHSAWAEALTVRSEHTQVAERGRETHPSTGVGCMFSPGATIRGRTLQTRRIVDGHQHRLGARLRAIRRQQGLTLHQVEARSDGHWKAVVVGSYERGDRAISVSKLARLASFYNVPLHDLMPVEQTSDTPGTSGPGTRVCLDLTRLSTDPDDAVLTAMTRYVRRIQVERGDYNGRVLTIRHDDLRAIANVFDLEPDDVYSRLDGADALLH